MKNQRLYLDYNATSPLASSVLELLASGDFPFANPASQHQSGKFSRKKINEVTKYFKEIYSLNDYEILYHSGATEAINLFCSRPSEGDIFIGFNSDHAAVTSQKARFDNKNITSFFLNPKSSGDFPTDEVNEILKTYPDQNIFFNFTWVHNETGIVWDLALLDELSVHKNLFIHVDAVQSVAKLPNFLKLNNRASMYTFSGHKFGSLKGIGMSFIKNDFKLSPLIFGGAQQGGLRSGTENPLGIISLKLSHKEWTKTFDEKELRDLKEEIINEIRSLLKEDFLLVGENASQNNLTTIDFIHRQMKADILLARFDLALIDVSSGSACSSGQIQASPTLLSLGFSELSRNSIRISFSSFEINKKDEIISSIQKVFKK